MCAMPGVGLREAQAQRREYVSDVVAQGLDVVAGAVHEDDEVVGIADDPLVRQAPSASSGASAGSAHGAACPPRPVRIEHAPKIGHLILVRRLEDRNRPLTCNFFGVSDGI
jgi:hypothetical protein